MLWSHPLADPPEARAWHDLVRLAWLRPGACVGWWSSDRDGPGALESREDVFDWAWSHPDRVVVRPLTLPAGTDEYAHPAGMMFPHITMESGEAARPSVAVVHEFVRACGDALLPAGAKIARSALAAGLLTQHDQFDAAHAAAQSIEGEGQPPLGDHWHAILHRREPDAGNARYWYRNVGRSPVYVPLAAWVEAYTAPASSASRTEIAAWQARLVRDGVWQPFAMIDLCTACADRPASDPLLGFATRVQAREMAWLFDATLRGTE